MPKWSSQTIHLLVGMVLLAGCTPNIHTSYQRPEVNMPATWVQPHNPAATPSTERWWEGFGDPLLNRLMNEVLERNSNLATAALRVRRAQLQADQADSNRLPSVSAQSNAAINRTLNGETNETRSFIAATSVRYELDLWGKLASAADAAHWEAVATEDDRAGAALSLTATTSSFYWRLGYLNQRITLSQASIDHARRTLDLVRVQKAAGAASGLELAEAERNLASQEAAHTSLLQQRLETRNSLAILFDRPPDGQATREPPDITGARLPEIGAGLPAQLLARRPDLRAAEARLRSTLANTDTTRASFYPTINLSGRLGTTSGQLSSLLNYPVASLGGELTLPFLQWRDMRRAIQISETDYQAAILGFRQSLYTAMTEVENSLSARQRQRQQAHQLETVLAAARQTEALYQVRYRNGGSPLIFWLDAQERKRQAENALAENRFNQVQTHIGLIKALGGEIEVQSAPAEPK